MLITDAEILWMKEYYPDLRFIKKDAGIITGNLQFDMFYDETNSKYIINPNSDCSPSSMRIKDSYQIEIVLQESVHLQIPIVKETGGRIEKVAHDNGIAMLDLHINNDGSACLCFIFDRNEYLPKGFNIPDFIHNLLIPFFYAQSFFERNHRWPWGEYEHGLFALFEWYAERKESTTDMLNKCLNFIENSKNIKGYKFPESIQTFLGQKGNIKGHQPCVCGSNIKFRDCHTQIFHGLWKMKKDVDSLINKYK